MDTPGQPLEHATQSSGMQDDGSNVNRRSSPASWTGSEVFLSIFLAWLFWPAAVMAVIKGVGVDHWFYDPNTPELDKRLGLWVGTLAAPFQILTYPFVFAAFSGTRLQQLGLTSRRWIHNVFAGLGMLLLLAPLVFGVWWLVRWCYGPGGEKEIEKHGLEVLATVPLNRSEWVMLFFTAMAAAPVHEELTFRGVLQPWLATRRWGAHFGMLAAGVLTLVLRGERMLMAMQKGIVPLLDAAAPALFILSLLPFFLIVSRLSRSPHPPAIFATSVLFACIHTSVWPTPIPLFVLALGLGVLAQRSGSLVGPIVLHSLFNGFSCLRLLLGV